MTAVTAPGPRDRASVRTWGMAGARFRVNLRVLSLIGVTAAVLAALAAWSMTLGSFPISVPDVVRSVFGRGAEDQEFIVRELRLPRVLVAILAGAALAMSGAVFQGLVRNPLVSPDIIGIDAGATVVAVAWILWLKDPAYLPIVAFVGAMATAIAIYGLTWRGGISSNRLILVGIGVSAVLGAFTTYLMLKYPIDRVSNARVWMTGSVYASDWFDVRVLALALAMLLPLAIVLMWPLRVLQYGDDTAHSLGLRVEPTRLLIIAAGCGLAATAVSIVGPVGFVAFMIPHIARMLAGPMTGAVLVLSAIIGAIFLLASDVVAQHFLPVTLPVGVVTGAIGAPYFLYLLYRTNAQL